MSWHDVVMISGWRQKNPSVESLLRAIAESLGIKFTGVASSASSPAREMDPASLPDPTASLREAFSKANFPDGIGRIIIPERPKL